MLVAAVWDRVPWCSGQLVHLFSDTATTVTIFQAEKGKDAFIQACARELLLSCAEFDIILGLSHMAGEDLTLTVDGLSRWHIGQHYKDHM